MMDDVLVDIHPINIIIKMAVLCVRSGGWVLFEITY